MTPSRQRHSYRLRRAARRSPRRVYPDTRRGEPIIRGRATSHAVCAGTKAAGRSPNGRLCAMREAASGSRPARLSSRLKPNGKFRTLAVVSLTSATRVLLASDRRIGGRIKSDEDAEEWKPGCSAADLTAGRNAVEGPAEGQTQTSGDSDLPGSRYGLSKNRMGCSATTQSRTPVGSGHSGEDRKWRGRRSLLSNRYRQAAEKRMAS